MDYFCLCHLLGHLQVTYLTYLLMSTNIRCQASLPVLWKLNQIRVESFSNNAVQNTVLIILCSFCVCCDFCTGMSHRKSQYFTPFVSLYSFSDLTLDLSTEVTCWSDLFWGDMTLMASFNFQAYTPDFERRHAGNFIVMKWMALIFSEEYFDWLDYTKNVVSNIQSEGTLNQWNNLVFQRSVQNEVQNGGKLLWLLSRYNERKYKK